MVHTAVRTYYTKAYLGNEAYGVKIICLHPIQHGKVGSAVWAGLNKMSKD